MLRNLSLITPSGRLTLGNHLGAFRGMVAAQEPPATASTASPTCTR